MTFDDRIRASYQIDPINTSDEPAGAGEEDSSSKRTAVWQGAMTELETRLK